MNITLGEILGVGVAVPLIAVAFHKIRHPPKPQAKRVAAEDRPLAAANPDVSKLTVTVMHWVVIATLLTIGLIHLIECAILASGVKSSLVATVGDFELRLCWRGCWPSEGGLALLLPIVVLPFLAVLFHDMDSKRGGGGIKDRIGSIRHPHSSLIPDVIAATMTKQSILAAIAAIFLASGNRGSLGAADFYKFATGVSRLGFTVALLLLVVSALSYDYANRFCFSKAEKYELVRKGLALDVSSWYVLIASYIVGLSATNVRTSIAVSLLTGYLVRWYYFVTPKELSGRAADQ